jgi:selenocysteine lyase/cysteine desulfurase
MPMPVIEAINSHIVLESEIGGYEAQDARSDAITNAYKSLAKLLGAKPNNIAFTENATASFMQALSSIPFASGDVILTTRNDYASNQIQFISLEARLGVQVIHAPDKADGGVDVVRMIELIERHQPRLVCVTHVPTNSGLVQDIESIGCACQELNVIYMVDACQSVGQMPIDVSEIHCDFLSATARKFLRGPRGSGFLYVSDRILQQGLEPLFIDMHGASWTGEESYKAVDSARRFENWEFAWSLVLGTAAAADYATNIGIDKIRTCVAGLVGLLRERLSGIDGVKVLGGDGELGGIVTIAVSDSDHFELVQRFRGKNINVSAQGREQAVLDYDKKSVAGALRISPHYYNTLAEIETLVTAIESR